VALHAPIACAGPLLAAELTALEKALAQPARPLSAVVGGAKVSSKLEVLDTLADIADHIVVGGGIANTFIAAAGHEVGKSLYEPELLDAARRIAAKVAIPLPVDVVVAKALAENESGVVRAITDVRSDEMILDIGPASARQFKALFNDAGTILWNGPMGVFEFAQLRRARHFRLPVVATRLRRSTNIRFVRQCPTSRPVAERFWNSSKARPCLQSRHLRVGRRTTTRDCKRVEKSTLSPT
jgi:3-phosphoglycerate kinase